MWFLFVLCYVWFYCSLLFLVSDWFWGGGVTLRAGDICIALLVVFDAVISCVGCLLVSFV